jgi:Ca-activated chloride channel family protein
MMKAVRAALEASSAQDHVRVVCFMTDGFVGNDFEIISEVQKHPNARVFAFGIGSSANRFLLDNMARHGRGEVEYVGLNDDGSAAARRFHERVRHPLLTDISIDWGGLPVADLYPRRIPDLFSARPVVVSGRYSGPAAGMVRLRGKMAGRDFVRDIRVNLPADEPRHDVLPALWARRRISDLMAQDYAGVQRSVFRPELQEQITQLGLEFRLLTQFTSFVAVEESVIIEGGEPKRIEVPVEMPEGVSYEGIFGDQNRLEQASAGMFFNAGFAGGVAGGVPALSRRAVVRPVAPLPEAAPAAGVKLHPWLAAAVRRVRTGGAPGPNEARFVRAGKALVQVYLSDTSAQTLVQLRKLGFELVAQPRSGSIVTGRIPVDKLAALAALEPVRYAAPVR